MNTENTKKLLSLLLDIQLLLSCALLSSAIVTDSVIETSAIGSEGSEEFSPRMAKGCAFNSLNLLGATSIDGYTVSMDLEYGGGYNIHMKIDGIKYYYDLGNNCWKHGVPKKLKENIKVTRALNHGLERIATGWQ